jgi:hypothetical protein
VILWYEQYTNAVGIIAYLVTDRVLGTGSVYSVNSLSIHLLSNIVAAVMAVIAVMVSIVLWLVIGSDPWWKSSVYKL